MYTNLYIPRFIKIEGNISCLKIILDQPPYNVKGAWSRFWSKMIFRF